MPRILRWILVGSLLGPTLVWSQQAVIDVSSIAQMVVQYATQVKQYAEQVSQTYNQVQQLRQQVAMVEMALRNLQHFNVNDIQHLLSLGQQLDGKLAQARMIGYQAQTVVGQAEAVYPKVTRALSGEQLIQTKQHWAAAQREAAQIGLQVQAIQGDHDATMQHIATLARASSATDGSLAAQQAQAQWSALQAAQMENLQGHLATLARLETLKTLEDASQKEATSQALSQAWAPLDGDYTPTGHWHSLTR